MSDNSIHAATANRKTMKYAVVLLALIAGSYAAPHPFGKDDDCNSEYCEALEDFYEELPGMYDDYTNEICDGLTEELFGDNSVTEFLDHICKGMAKAEKGELIDEIDEQIEEQGEEDGCKIGKRKVNLRQRRAAARKPVKRVARKFNFDDCDNTPICQELEEVYKEIPQDVDEMETEACDELPKWMQDMCFKMVDEYKKQLVEQLQEQVEEKGEEFGCEKWGPK